MVNIVGNLYRLLIIFLYSQINKRRTIWYDVKDGELTQCHTKSDLRLKKK